MKNIYLFTLHQALHFLTHCKGGQRTRAHLVPGDEPPASARPTHRKERIVVEAQDKEGCARVV